LPTLPAMEKAKPATAKSSPKPKKRPSPKPTSATEKILKSLKALTPAVSDAKT